MTRRSSILVLEQHSNVHQERAHVDHQSDPVDVVFAIWHDDFETRSNQENNLSKGNSFNRKKTKLELFYRVDR